MKHLIVFLIGLAAIIAALPAFAQPCYPRDAVAEGLRSEYGETLRMRALTSGGHLVELFAAPSGTWTLILTRPDGLSCAMDSGEAIEMVEPVEGDPA
ncbi:hypothetical protein [Roseovarius ramblicola]|uniref:Uncharacterized protein n=1 Tax=Roseovarius ramblicola TaxID=2022336 RepID=A0ABV5HWE7_9RHOB